MRLSARLLSRAGGPAGPQPSPEVGQLCDSTDLGMFALLAQRQHAWGNVQAFTCSEAHYEPNPAVGGPERDAHSKGDSWAHAVEWVNP